MKKKITIRVENSAPSQAKPAKSVKWASSILCDNDVKKVVDFGCGRLRNIQPLKDKFKFISFVDTELQCQRIRASDNYNKKLNLLSDKEFEKKENKYDAIFMISIFHILPQKAMRKRLLLTAISKLKPNGYLVVDVPTGEAYYRKKCTAENKYRDGYLMGSGNYRTFYKKFYAPELDKLLSTDNHLKLFKKIYFDKHLIRIMQKSESDHE